MSASRPASSSAASDLSAPTRLVSDTRHRRSKVSFVIPGCVHGGCQLGNLANAIAGLSTHMPCNLQICCNELLGAEGNEDTSVSSGRNGGYGFQLTPSRAH